MSPLKPRVKIVVDAEGGVEILGNRAGMEALAEYCNALRGLSDEEAKTAANHFEIADYMNNAVEGSVPTLLTLKLDL